MSTASGTAGDAARPRVASPPPEVTGDVVDRWRYPLVGYAVAFFGGSLSFSAWLAFGGGEDSIGAVVSSMVGLWLGFLGAPAWVARRAGIGLSGLLTVRASARWVLGGALLGVVAQLVVVPVLSWPLQWVLPDADVSSAARDLVDRASGPGVVVLGVAVIVVGPIVEEVFFRGLLQRVACARLGAVLGVVVASVGFAMTHFQPVQLLGLIGAGVCFGVIAWRSRSIGAAIAAHAAFNATAFVGVLAGWA